MDLFRFIYRLFILRTSMYVPILWQVINFFMLYYGNMFLLQSKLLCSVDLDITLYYVFNHIYAFNCCLNEIYALKMNKCKV